MIARLEALVALARHGTTSRAAVALRLTQSAVSKRIAALEAQSGRRLVEPHGRRLRLTAAGAELARRAEGLLGQLREAVEAPAEGPAGRVAAAMSESLLASWGAGWLARAAARVPGVELEVHAHRGPVAVDRVRSGEVSFAVVAGPSDAAPDLACETLAEEEMVIVPSGGSAARLRGAAAIDVLAIERASATWRAVARRLPHLRAAGGPEIRVAREAESHAALVQMARAKMGHALAPIGVARALGVPLRGLVRLTPPGLTRPVSLCARPSNLARASVAALRDALRATVPYGAGITPSSR